MNITTCQICGEQLTNEESVRNGIGPVCARKQQKYLAACGVTLSDVDQLIATKQPEVLRWVRVAFLAIGKRRLSEVQQFLNRARREAVLVA